MNYLLIILSFTLATNCTTKKQVASNEHTNIVTFSKSGLKLISFDFNKIELSDGAKNSLDSIAERFKGNPQAASIRLYTYTCPFEQAKDKFLGAKRAIAITDYMEQKHEISRRKFEIIDEPILSGKELEEYVKTKPEKCSLGYGVNIAFRF